VLILTRRVGETLVIGSSIRVTVVGLRGTQVRIGIGAPRSVSVHREELYERIQRNERTLREPKTDPTRTIERILNGEHSHSWNDSCRQRQTRNQ